MAFSKDTTYKINDSVQVTIPNGDYDQQKIIIGKYVADDETPYIFTQPFDTIIDVSANLIDDTVKSSAGLRANDDYDNDSIPLVHEEFLWSKVFDEEYRDFERLGIQGQFRSRIKSLNPVSGDYGYRLEVLSCRDELVNDATYNSLIPEIARIYSSILNGIDYNTEVLDKIPNSWYNKIATTLKLNGSDIKDAFIQAFNEADEVIKKDMVYALLYANAHITEMYLNSSDMYGDPYNFQSFFEQEKVFDISSLKAIYGMTLFFYEKSATFLTAKGEQIPYRTKVGGKVPPNLHTKDPYICLGYDLSNFDSEQAILFTTDGSTYKTKDNVSIADNQKFIRLRWLHLFENGNIGVVSESSNLSDYEIRWYKFRMGAPSADEYSGVYWDRVNLPEVVKETIPLDNINSLDTFYLRYHYLPGTFTEGYENTYTETFKPIYKDVGQVQYDGGWSHLSFWTDECIAKYGVSKELASHSYIGQITSYITKYVDQSWSDIFDQGFVYHENSRIKTDDYNNKTFPVGSGCMHKIGFWEKFCLAYRLYWVYPEEFDLLLNDSIWRNGGSNPTGAYDASLGLWSNYKGKNIYTDISYQGSILYPTKEYNKFNVSSMNDAIGNLFTLFTDSFGQWEYITDEYGMKDFVPSDTRVRNRLYEATKLFYAKLDNPTYERIIEEDPFSYILNPAPNTSSEQVKAIVLYDNKVIRSNILTFTNEIEPASSATAELIAGLSIWCKDGSYGNYCRYGQNNQLMDSVQPNENIQKITADTVFTFEARFADKSILAENYNVDAVASMLHEAKEITWEFPLQNSMVIVQGFNYSYPIYDNEWINKDQGLINYETLYANDDLNNGARYKLEGFYNDAIIKVRGNSIYITRKCAEDGSINALQDYRINKTFNSSALNNTIKCTILKDGLIYSATKELTFGIMGTNGTDATVVIDFDNNKTALTANLDSETLKVTAHLYDSSHKEIDFQDVTNKNIECYWSWDSYMVEPGQDINLEQRLMKVDNEYVVVDETIPRNVCYLSHNTRLNIRNKNFFLVLKITIKGFGDYDLIAYKAIPIRADKRFRNIIGPTEVIYNTTGHPDYYKDKFTLWWCADENKITEYDTVTDETAITNIASNWTIYNPYAEDSNLIGTISNNILKPATIYVKKANPYGAYCYLNTADGGTADPVWIQPFVIIQNEYPSATINKWNGKEIKIDSDNGFILSPAIAAGSKDSENRFYGVMIGDWSNDIASADITKQTGVYGFHAGALSFAFKEDGTAFIGKSGRGRIELDGNNGILKSASWTDDHESGMYLDLDDGILKIQKEAGYDAIRIEAGEYQKGKYYVQKNTYSPVALNTPYDKTVVYYKKGLIALPSIDEANFAEKKNKGILYVQSKPVYKQCANDASFSDNIVYYQNNFIAVADVTEEIFKANKQRYYTESDGIYTKLPNDAVFTEGVVYYTQGEGVSEVHITKEQFEKNPSQFYYLEEQTIGKVANNASFDPELKYYQEGYLAQTYGLSSAAPYPEWNTSEDSQLENGETYYTLSESTYVISNDIYDPGQTYYIDNTSEEARYITLSAAERTFPLSIGTDALEDDRKFRVAWDGTCYIEDGEFSGNINAETGTLGELTLTGWLNVVDGAHINVDRDGYIYVGPNGFIDLDKNAFITMNKGGFLQLSANGGHIKCDKLALDDVATQGFWLDKEGFHVGDYARYFYSSPNAIGFYSNLLGYDGSRITYFPGSLRMSGHALDMYCSAMEEGWGADESQLIQAAKNGLAKITSQDFYDEGAIRIGWEPNRTYFHPYLRLGFGTYTKGATTPDYYMADAAVIKKYTGGIWIGNYGYGNYIGDGGTSLNNPFVDPRIYCGMFCYTGSHYLTYSTASKAGPEWGLGESGAVPTVPTVFRCEVISDGKGGYKTIYEPARYARFA